MNILIFNAYYTPEVAASMYLEEDIAFGFANAGHHVLMYVPTPCRGIDDEIRNKYKHIKEEKYCDGRLVIKRYPLIKENNNVMLRALRYILQNIKQYLLGIQEKDIDVIFCGSTPPTQGLVCSLIKKMLKKRYGKNVRFVFNLQDIFPDSLVAAGLAKQGSIVWKIGRVIENKVYESADRIIVISESFKKNLMDKNVPVSKIQVVHNWIDTKKVKPVEKKNNVLFEEYNISRNKYTVVYAGNFGVAQGAEIVILAAEKMKQIDDIQFVIFGGGNNFNEARNTVQRLNLKNVFIYPLLSQERVSEVYSMGDVALITCKKGFGVAGMPSKTWSIMACNTPILASFDENSELAKIICESGMGECIEPENLDLLVETLLRWYKNTAAVTLMGRQYVEVNASKEFCISQYCDAIYGD